MERLSDLEKDYYCDDLSDDCASSESSHDEDENRDEFLSDVYTNGQFENSASLRANSIDPGSAPKKFCAAEDDFEREANEQLTSDLNAQCSNWFGRHVTLGGDESSSTIRIDPHTDDPHYPENNDARFVPSLTNPDQDNKPGSSKGHRYAEGADSDEEFFENEKKKFKDYDRSNDELFYDPRSDDDNQNWVNTKRRSYHGRTSLTKSDAVLNCPACMTVLCYDCQQHEIYKTQYRAMFVTNCEVKDGEVLFVPCDSKSSKNKKGAGMKLKTASSIRSGLPQPNLLENCDSKDLFKPVVCAKCNTEVAVFDSDEVYHFFNVLSSHV